MIKKALLSTLLLSHLVANDGEALAERLCGECHLMGVTSKEKIDNMKAPPYWALAKKARESYATYDEQVAYIIDYSLDPNEAKMLFPIQTKERFGVMPSLSGKVNKEELKEIAGYILR
ncbi:MAG: cytochrome c [Sulfuricurvum sp.]